jgi:hypothetical protein
MTRSVYAFVAHLRDGLHEGGGRQPARWASWSHVARPDAVRIAGGYPRSEPVACLRLHAQGHRPSMPRASMRYWRAPLICPVRRDDSDRALSGLDPRLSIPVPAAALGRCGRPGRRTDRVATDRVDETLCGVDHLNQSGIAEGRQQTTGRSSHNHCKVLPYDVVRPNRSAVRPSVGARRAAAFMAARPREHRTRRARRTTQSAAIPSLATP